MAGPGQINYGGGFSANTTAVLNTCNFRTTQMNANIRARNNRAQAAQRRVYRTSASNAVQEDRVPSSLAAGGMFAVLYGPSVFWSGVQVASGVGKVLAGAGSLAKGAAVAVVGSHAAIPVALVAVTAAGGKMLYDRIYPDETENQQE